MRASELSRDRVEDARTVLSVGSTIEAKFIGVDRKKRTISLSVAKKRLRRPTNFTGVIERSGSSEIHTPGHSLR